MVTGDVRLVRSRQAGEGRLEVLDRAREVRKIRVASDSCGCAGAIEWSSLGAETDAGRHSGSAAILSTRLFPA